GRRCDLHSFPTRRSSDLAFAIDRSGDPGIRKLASTRLARIGNPRDDGAIARAKVDEASLTDVDHAVEPVEILDLHHRGNDAAERDRKSTRLNSSHVSISY